MAPSRGNLQYPPASAPMDHTADCEAWKSDSSLVSIEIRTHLLRLHSPVVFKLLSSRTTDIIVLQLCIPPPKALL
jgi:hypothetical protein